MDISLVYLVQRLGLAIVDFLRHWYIDGFFRGAHWSYNFLEKLDKIFALRITFRYLFRPLYQDYCLIGYFWGFIFRSLRLIIGGALYLVFAVISLGLYILWAAIPIVAVYKIFSGNG